MNATKTRPLRAFAETAARKNPVRRAEKYTAYVVITAVLLAVCGPVVAAVVEVFTR